MVRRWLLAVIVALSLGAMAMPLQAQAIEDALEIQVEFIANHEACEGVEFRAYEIGMRDGDAIESNVARAETPRHIDGATLADDAQVVEELHQAIVESGRAPTARATTDAEGKAVLGPLDDRVYLVEGDEAAIASSHFVPQSFLAVPGDVAHPKPVLIDESGESSPLSELEAPSETSQPERSSGTFAKTSDGLTIAALIAAMGALFAFAVAGRGGRRRLRIAKHPCHRRLW